MKIGFVAHDVHRRGGMERAATEVVSRLVKKHDVVLAAEQCELVANRLKWVPVNAPRKPSLVNAIVFRRRVSRLKELGDCDIVGSVGASAIEAEVITAQFCHAAYTAGFGGLRGGSGLNRRTWQRYVQGVFCTHERRAYTSGRLRRVIAVSRGTARELSEFYGVDPAIISIIPNAVDHTVFKPADSVDEKLLVRKKLGIEYDGMLAVFLGGDWGRKGVADVIRAIGRTPNVCLAIVGRWKIEPFYEIARSVGAMGRVHFVGETTAPQDWLAASDVFVFPSRYEAFSLGMIEAAACGLPLIVTRVNGAEELVEHGVNGFFVLPDPDDIAASLACLRDDPSKRNRMGKAAYRSSLSYAWDAVAESHERVYQSACGWRTGTNDRR